MGKSLVIVESPAKAKTINQYLGANFIVKSSVGHIRDLPKSGQSKNQDFASNLPKPQQSLVNRMGINPYDKWQACYEIMPGKEKVVKELKALAAKADKIYLATDLDREGESIAWHLQEIIGGDKKKFSRVVFNEITKSAIKQAFEHPQKVDMDKVHAQQTRRFLDRVVGFMVSPLLWKKVARGLSAGRVQSVAVKLIVEKEREIKAFVPQEYWNIQAKTQAKQGALNLDLTTFKGEKWQANNKAQADKAVSELQNQQFIVKNVENKPTISRPNAPFTTSTLQQSASTQLGFGVKTTMSLAQRLYEAGFITYMRTDSTNLSADAIKMARDFISKNFAKEYLPAKPNIYASKKNAQEAHEAIRPTNVNLKVEDLSGIEQQAMKLYHLIWQRFIACQMTEAKFDLKTITVQAGDYGLKTTGRTLVFDGFIKVLNYTGNTNDLLVAVDNNEILQLQELLPSQHFTKPPARFREASLVQELEKRGIGRPSTYASIISTIQDRGYVYLEDKKFYATKMGEIVTDRLNDSFANLMNYGFTAQMESDLDEIAQGKKNWLKELDQFFTNFTAQLEQAEKTESQGGMKVNSAIKVNLACPKCSRAMHIKVASSGIFLSCSGYEVKEDQCKTTISLSPLDQKTIAGDETNELMAKKRCPKCSSAMDDYAVGDLGHKLHICGNNPNCDGNILDQSSNPVTPKQEFSIDCDKCIGIMSLKTGRFGKYMACNNCSNTRKVLASGEVAPPKEAPIEFPELKCSKNSYFVLRYSVAGIFLSAYNFPKVRDTRPVKVAELVQFKDRLPEKWHYFTLAPILDPEGNPAIVGFSRKDKCQIITSVKNNKRTKWRLDYKNGAWVENKG